MVLGTGMGGCKSSPQMTSDQQRGQRIYETLCDKCHKLISPRQHTDNEWIAASDRYGLRLKLQTNEVALLKAYLTRANDTDF